MRLANNTVLITGGGSGIGFALAEAFLAAGSIVGVCGRSDARLLAAVARRPLLRYHACDLALEEGRRGLLEWASRELPTLNVLVNNAGVQRDIDLTHGIDDFLAGDNEIRINLESPIVLTGLFAPLLSRNPAPVIINVSSGLGFVPAARMPVYCASKAGLHAFTMAVRRQFAPQGFKVFEIVPPAVDTQLNPSGRAGRGNFKPELSAETFVAAVMKGLESDIPEIGYGMTQGFVCASRQELDERFEQMNQSMGGPRG